MSVWLLGGLSLVALCCFPLYGMEMEKFQIHYVKCYEIFVANQELLLNSNYCDRGQREFTYNGKVDCATAREENRWGPSWCALCKWWDNFVFHRGFEWIRKSWAVYGFLLVVSVFWVRAWWTHRSEVAKHTITAAAWREASANMRIASGPYIAGGGAGGPPMMLAAGSPLTQRALRAECSSSRGSSSMPQMIRGYLRAPNGGFVYVDNTPGYYMEGDV